LTDIKTNVLNVKLSRLHALVDLPLLAGFLKPGLPGNVDGCVSATMSGV